jgi:hypothetical protein
MQDFVDEGHRHTQRAHHMMMMMMMMTVMKKKFSKMLVEIFLG